MAVPVESTNEIHFFEEQKMGTERGGRCLRTGQREGGIEVTQDLDPLMFMSFLHGKNEGRLTEMRMTSSDDMTMPFLYLRWIGERDGTKKQSVKRQK